MKRVHFIDEYFFNPPHPISVNLIGAGGTGSQVLTALARMNFAMNQLGHAGFQVRLWDGERVSQANLGRQLFARSELGFYKSSALINRCNRFFGTCWKAETEKFARHSDPENLLANLYISCTDSVNSRFETAEILTSLRENFRYLRGEPKYWLDFGNGRNTGQALLSTVGEVKQPASQKYETIANLPFITEEFGEILKNSEQQDDTPSCSLAEALEKQDLFINSALAQAGCSLLWNLLRNGFTLYRGFFMNLENFRSQPIKV